MSEALDIFGLYLCGYIPMGEHGFAVPCFSNGPIPNTWYVATCSVSGDHLGQITEFETCSSESICLLPTEHVQFVQRGDLWRDVFLWNGLPHVGQPHEIWSSLKMLREDVAARAPISLLDLGSFVESVSWQPLAMSAFNYVQQNFGITKAKKWRRDTFFRQRIVLYLNRMARDGKLNASPALLQAVEITEHDGGSLRMEAPASLEQELLSTGIIVPALQELQDVADSFSMLVDLSAVRGANIIAISRAGRDEEIARQISEILRAAGNLIVLQNERFGHSSFMRKLHEVLEMEGRLIALLSPAYLESKDCRSEWQSTLAGDPQNAAQRLIVFRVAKCRPTGLLKGIPYIDLVSLLDDPVKMAEIVRKSVSGGSSKSASGLGTVIDGEINWEVPSFTGREDTLAKLRDEMFKKTGMVAGARQSAIFGMGGVGKSSVAREYAWRNRDSYSILWWLNAEKEDGVIDGLIRLGSRFIPGIDKEPDRNKAAKFVLERGFSGLNKPALLVFDNLEDRTLLTKWKPNANCHLLTTTRLQGWGSSVRTVHLEQWPPDDAREYLLNESGRRDLKPDQAGRIAETVGYLPLALAHAAAYLRDNAATTALDYISRVEQYMDRVPSGAEYPRAVFATFQEALARAEARAPGAAAILCLAAFFAPDDIPLELFEQKVDFYSDELRPILGSSMKSPSIRAVVGNAVARETAFSALTALSLISLKIESRSFSVHRLIQSACRDLSDVARMEWVANAIIAANEAFPYVEFENWPVCARLVPHAEAASAVAPDSIGLPLARLMAEAGVYLHERAQYDRAEQLLRRSLAICEEELGADDPIVSARLDSLASVLEASGRGTEAELLFRRALTIDEKNYGADHAEVATALNNLASLLCASDQYIEAEPLIRRAIAIDEKLFGHDHPGVAIELSNLAGVLSKTARAPEAEPLYRRALQIHEKSHGPHHPHVATDLNNLAILLWETGRSKAAISLMNRAVKIRRASLGEDHPHTQMSSRAAEMMVGAQTDVANASKKPRRK